MKLLTVSPEAVSPVLRPPGLPWPFAPVLAAVACAADTPGGPGARLAPRSIFYARMHDRKIGLKNEQKGSI